MLKLATKLNSLFTRGDVRYWTFLGGIFALSLRVLVGAQPASAEFLLTDGASQILTANAAMATVQAKDSPVYGPDVPPAIHEVLLEVCKSRGYGEECAKHLLGMAFKESRFESDAVGDQGRSHGYFQIQYRLHSVSLECTRDLRCSADWTISYLESNGYPKNTKSAIQCHNGCGVNNGYAASVLRNGKRLWAQAYAKPIALK